MDFDGFESTLRNALSSMIGDEIDSLICTKAWKSRTATLGLFSRIDGLETEQGVVVKVGDMWGANYPEQIAAWAERLGEIRVEGARVVPILRWSGDPPAIVMPYIPGDELQDLLRSPRLAAREPSVSADELVRKAGSLLGALHSQLLRKRFVYFRRVISVGDYAIYNFRVDRDRNLVLIDVMPRPSSSVSPFRDVAWFIEDLDRRLGSEDGSLKRAFLSGYAESRESDRWGLRDDIGLRVALERRRRGRRRAAKRRQQRQPSSVNVNDRGLDVLYRRGSSSSDASSDPGA